MPLLAPVFSARRYVAFAVGLGAIALIARAAAPPLVSAVIGPQATAERDDEERAPCADVPATAIRRDAAGVYLVPRGVFDRCSKVPCVLLPALIDHRMVGLKFDAVGLGPMLAALGIEAGDIVISVNGVSLASVHHSLELYEQVRASTDEITVEILRHGQRHALRYRFVDGPTGATGIRRDADGVYVVPRAVADAPATWGGRIVPQLTNGRPSGIKLYAIRPGAPLHALGLRNRDIVTAVAGVPVTSSDSCFEPYARLGPPKDEFAIEGLRADKRFTLRVRFDLDGVPPRRLGTPLPHGVRYEARRRS